MSYKGKIGVTVLALIALVIVLGVGFSTLKAPVTAIQQAREAWVDDDDPTCGGNSPCFRTIQAAIDAVAEGGTVFIGPGTYQENIQIAKSIRLVGAHQGSVVITGSPEPPPDWSIQDQPIIDITKAPHHIQVYLANFTIRYHGRSSGIKVVGPVQFTAHQLSVFSAESLDWLSGFFLAGDIAHLSQVEVKGAGQGIFSTGNLIVEESIIDENIIGISALWRRLEVKRSLLARNGIAIGIGGGWYGGEVARLVENAITSNGVGLYMVLGRQERVWYQNQPELGASVVVMGGNEITGNGLGIALLECPSKRTSFLRYIFPFIMVSIAIKQSSIAFMEMMEQANRIESNSEADLCPADYPWPPGFRK